MRSSNLLFSCVHLSVTLLILAFGLCLMVVPYSEVFAQTLSAFLLSSKSLIFSIGAGVAFSGLFLMVGFFFMHRKRYYKIEMKCGKMTIEEAIIKEYVQDYWKSIFPGQTGALEITLGAGQKIEIVTQLPDQVAATPELFEKIKNELGALLAKRLGYDKEFILTITD